MQNRNISRKTLQCHDIHYEEDVYQGPYLSTQSISRPLPDHVDAVREALLSFEGIIPVEWKKDLSEELAEFEDVATYPDWIRSPQKAAFIRRQHNERAFQECNTEHNIAHKNLQRFQQAARRARQLLEEPEPEWSYFWRSEVFLLFNDEAQRQSGFHPTLDAWSVYESALWNEFESLMKPLPFVERRTQPKPDLTYAFPIQDTSFKGPKGLSRDELFQTLSLKVLGSLIPHGISCVPTTGLRNWTKDPEKASLRGPDRSCFPWAIVEMKRHAASHNESIETERCYCQAANAAAAALELQEQLFGRLGEISPELPPIIAFTCVGPIVKVWLAYQDQQTKHKHMICIWSTSVRLTWGVASLRSIVLNMHTWASRMLKPKIQACVYQVSRHLNVAIPQVSRSSTTGSSDERSWASGVGDQPATSSISTSKIAKTCADVTSLTNAFESSSITDACGRGEEDDQHPVGRLRKVGTASVAFLSHKEGECVGTGFQHYQTITFQAPYQEYSLEELRVADYEHGRRYAQPIEDEEKEVDVRGVGTDDLRPDEASNYNTDCNACEHSDPDDCSCSESQPDSENASQCEEHAESDTFDGEDDFDFDFSDVNRDYWIKQSRMSVKRKLLSFPVSDERRVPWPSLKEITRCLCTTDRKQIRLLAEGFRNIDGTRNVPLRLVLGLLNNLLEEARRIV